MRYIKMQIVMSYRSVTFRQSGFLRDIELNGNEILHHACRILL